MSKRFRNSKDATPAARATRFLTGLSVPEGPRVGERLKLAPFQTQFVEGALADGVTVAALSIGRGNGKSALAAGLALGALVGAWDPQPRRDAIIAARTRDQAAVAWRFASVFAACLPDAIQQRFTFRRSPRLEIEYAGENGDGPHILRAVAADGRSALGSGPTFVLMDERAHWQPDRGDALEAALLTGAGKRGAKTLIISTSGPDDQNAFSRWLDSPPPGAYVQEHRPPPGLPADDLESLLIANPGAEFGIGASRAWLQNAARQAVARGGSALSNFRLYHRNERVSGESRDLLLTLDQWLSAEVAVLPPREGPVVVGIDLGGSASMSAAAFYWPDSSRLEAYGWFPSIPGLMERGSGDGVGDRYAQMQARGELSVIGAKTVPVAEWLGAVWRKIENQNVAALVADRYKAAELGEAIQRAGIAAPIVWRGMGWRDGAEDVERFRRATFDGQVKCAESLLMRSAISEAVCLRDPANNLKLAKARSLGRIDAAAAAILSVAEGARIKARPAPRPARLIWA